MSKIFTVNIQSDVAELERMAREYVEKHLEDLARFQVESIVANRINQHIEQQVAAALDTPEVAAVLNSVVTKKTRAEIDKKILKLTKKLGGT
jgi:hypothetical protein